MDRSPDADNGAVNDPFSMAEDKNLAVKFDKKLKRLDYSKWNVVHLHKSRSKLCVLISVMHSKYI